MKMCKSFLFPFVYVHEVCVCVLAKTLWLQKLQPLFLQNIKSKKDFLRVRYRLFIPNYTYKLCQWKVPIKILSVCARVCVCYCVGCSLGSIWWWCSETNPWNSGMCAREPCCVKWPRTSPQLLHW